MYLKGSKWSMNKRRQSFNWFRIILLMLLIAAGLYFDRVVLPTTPSPFQSTPTPTRPPESFLTEAQTLFDAGKLTQSIQAYEQGIAAQPNDPTSYVALAQVQVWAGDYKGAQASAENALLLNTNNSMAHALRAWALDFQGNTLEAEASVKKALELDDRNAVAHAFYAEILVDEGTDGIPKAIDESQVAMTLAPDTLITHRARGYVLEATGNYEEAVREYQAAIAKNPNISNLHMQLGINYTRLGISDQAVQEFAKANSLNPADPEPDYYTSRTYLSVGEYAKARQYAQTAVHDDPTNPRYHGNLGVMDYKNGLFSDAIKELGLAVKGGVTDKGEKVEPLELVPGSFVRAEFYFTYALSLAKTGRCGEVIQIAQQVQAIIPNDEVSVNNVNQAIQICQVNLEAGPGTVVAPIGTEAAPAATEPPAVTEPPPVTEPPAATATP